MTHTKKIALLIDGNSLLHRAWHAIPPLTTKDGTIVNAVYGFCDGAPQAPHREKTNAFGGVLGCERRHFSRRGFEDYKATRVEKEQELYDQIPLVDALLQAYGIPSFGGRIRSG